MRAICLVSVLAVSAPGVARAAVGSEPSPKVTPYVDRGLMLGKAQAYAVFGVSGSTAPIDESTVDTSLRLGVGITDRFSVDGSLGTLSLAPSARLRSPNVGAWYGLVDRPSFELDATARVTFGVGEGRIVSLVEPGAAAIFRAGHAVRIDTGAFLPIAPGTGVGVRVPLRFSVQLGRYVHASVSSGVAVDDVGHAASSTSVPLAISLGVSGVFAGGGGIGVSPSVSWPLLVDTSRVRGEPIATVVGATLSIATP